MTAMNAMTSGIAPGFQGWQWRNTHPESGRNARVSSDQTAIAAGATDQKG
jgi:hypothetical protein